MCIRDRHQSTVNENMPLRSLLYIGRAYERLVPPRSRYKKKIVFLPTPEFYTFYNGKEKWEKEKELRLSDAYIVKDGEPSLELKVKVINIRPEEHHEILEKCQVLKEYSQFMEIVQNLSLIHIFVLVQNQQKQMITELIRSKMLKWELIQLRQVVRDTKQ